jgi:hypothetical protein
MQLVNSSLTDMIDLPIALAMDDHATPAHTCNINSNRSAVFQRCLARGAAVWGSSCALWSSFTSVISRAPAPLGYLQTTIAPI